MITDQDIIMTKNKHGRIAIENQTIKKAVHYFQTYQEIYGDEAAQELLAKSLESVQFVIDALDKELTFAPQTMLGVVLSPELVSTIGFFLGSILLGII